MNLINEDALAVMIAKVVKEQRPSLEEDLTAKTIGINEFRRDYCQGKSAEWVRVKIFDRYPEVVFDPVKKTGWVLNPHGQGKKTIIWQKQAAKWLEDHMYEIDWGEKL